jgi:hypothetical protein
MPLANMYHFLIYALFIFSLTPFGWLCSVMLTPTYSIIYYGNIIFDLHPLFQEHN